MRRFIERDKHTWAYRGKTRFCTKCGVTYTPTPETRWVDHVYSLYKTGFKNGKIKEDITYITKH